MVLMEGKIKLLSDFILLLIPPKNLYRYLSLQLLERFSQPDEKFEIKEIEVYGWGKTCLTDVA